MTAERDVIAILVAEALMEGDGQCPVALIEAIKVLPPFRTLMAVDPPPEPFTVLRKIAPGCEKLSHRRRADLTGAERRDLLRLLRWSLREFAAWSARGGQAEAALEATFLIFQVFGFAENHWELLPDAWGANTEIRDRIVGLLGHSRIEMSAGPGRRQEREQALVQRILEADRQGDWAVVAEGWRPLSGFLPTPLLYSQGIPFLLRYHPGHLLRVADQVAEMSGAWMMARQMSPLSRFRIARDSSSARFRFAAVLYVEWEELEDGRLPASPAADLTQLLLSVSRDPAQWRPWMTVFNRHPSRFPWLQPSLGMALAAAPADALGEYIDSLRLYPWPIPPSRYGAPSRADDRTCVGMCLESFRSAASPSTRKMLWTRAHARWTAWDFQGKEHKLIYPCCCELDCALVWHARENMTPPQRMAMIREDGERIATLESKWHASKIDLLDARNRRLSAMQPVLASERLAQEIWQTDAPLWPECFAESAYARRRYSA